MKILSLLNQIVYEFAKQGLDGPKAISLTASDFSKLHYEVSQAALYRNQEPIPLGNIKVLCGHGFVTVNQHKERKIMKPTIGRVVHYQKYGTPGGEHKPEPSPAVITQVYEDGTTCQLAVMNPNGVYFNKTEFAGDEPKPGHWNWPPREETK